MSVFMRKIGLLMVLFCSLCCCSTSKQAAAEANNTSLLNTQWTILEVMGTPVPQTSEKVPFIVFESDGNYHGYSGCNRFFGSYFVQKKKISFKYSGSTKMLCADMDTEKIVLNAFKSEIHHFLIEGNVMSLYTHDGTLVAKMLGTELQKEQ